jgi:hypothetical protein
MKYLINVNNNDLNNKTSDSTAVINRNVHSNNLNITTTTTTSTKTSTAITKKPSKFTITQQQQQQQVGVKSMTTINGNNKIGGSKSNFVHKPFNIITCESEISPSKTKKKLSKFPENNNITQYPVPLLHHNKVRADDKIMNNKQQQQQLQQQHRNKINTSINYEHKIQTEDVILK